jgi:hypothetical protein
MEQLMYLELMQGYKDLRDLREAKEVAKGE